MFLNIYCWIKQKNPILVRLFVCFVFDENFSFGSVPETFYSEHFSIESSLFSMLIIINIFYIEHFSLSATTKLIFSLFLFDNLNFLLALHLKHPLINEKLVLVYQLLGKYNSIWFCFLHILTVFSFLFFSSFSSTKFFEFSGTLENLPVSNWMKIKWKDSNKVKKVK